ncbi:MAG: VCBS repeat-containing protein [Akkermansiaceae bacterium]|nr:VCBS repeat-containing protein [Akkermansiaceae bacterium]
MNLLRHRSLPAWVSAAAFLAAAASAQEKPAAAPAPVDPGGWVKHVVHEGFPTNAVQAADFNRDGKTDIVASSGGKVRVFLAPDWSETAVYLFPKGQSCIHCEVMDVDGDGDPDYLGGNSKGPVFWLENPRSAENPNASGLWTYRVVEPDINGYHCLLVADVNKDGKPDLLMNNFEPTGPLADSMLWAEVPEHPRTAQRWNRHVFAKGDAPGGSHYLGFGDLDGDGFGEIAAGAKGEPFQGGNWFAFWTHPGAGGDATAPWKKTVVSTGETAATNIHPADVNGDGKPDLVASRGHGFGVLWFEAPDWRKHDIQPDIEGPHCLAVADFDGDGDLDAATCGKDSMWVMLHENDGKGNFANHRLDNSQAAYDIRAADIDDDGDLDILIAGQASKNVVWYANPLK